MTETCRARFTPSHGILAGKEQSCARDQGHYGEHGLHEAGREHGIDYDLALRWHHVEDYR